MEKIPSNVFPVPSLFCGTILKTNQQNKIFKKAQNSNADTTVIINNFTLRFVGSILE